MCVTTISRPLPQQILRKAKLFFSFHLTITIFAQNESMAESEKKTANIPTTTIISEFHFDTMPL